MRFFIIFFLCSSLASSQKFVEPKNIKSFHITVNYEDYTIKTEMLKDKKNIKVDNERTYLWYDSHKIMETKGGYDGKLIHGYYKSFYLNDQLREMGEVKYGLKNNTWKTWYSDGKLKEIIHYKRGQKNGSYELYNEYGKRMARGTFKKDLLNGKFYTYDNLGKTIEIKKYREGVEIAAKPRKAKNKDKNNEASSVEKAKKEKRKAGKKQEEKSGEEKPEKTKGQKKSQGPDEPNSKKKESDKKSFGQKLGSLFKNERKTSETDSKSKN